MTMSCPLAITATGMVTGVGLDSDSSCAAIRSGISNFTDLDCHDQTGEVIVGCPTPLSGEINDRLRAMAVSVIQECRQKYSDLKPDSTAIMLCLAEQSRVGRVPDKEEEFFEQVQHDLGYRFHEKSRVIAQGKVSLAVALHRAREYLTNHLVTHVMIVGVDTLLSNETLKYLEDKQRLKTITNSDGLIPGEAAAAIVVEPAARVDEPYIQCSGLGFAEEIAHIDSNLPIKADGLVNAIQQSLKDASIEDKDLDFRISDLSGEQYYFKEASLAVLRVVQCQKQDFDIWHPADCIGEVGAAMGPVMLIVIKKALEKDYAKGHTVLAHLSADDGKRAAIILNLKP